jgi:hypothetical protein
MCLSALSIKSSIVFRKVQPRLPALMFPGVLLPPLLPEKNP